MDRDTELMAALATLHRRAMTLHARDVLAAYETVRKAVLQARELERKHNLTDDQRRRLKEARAAYFAEIQEILDRTESAYAAYTRGER